MKKNYFFTLVLLLFTQFFWAQITVSTVSSFVSCAGSPSAPQIISVNDPLPGVNDLTVSAPAGFEIKKVSDSNYSSSLTIARNSGSLGLGTIPRTQLHIRLKSDATGTPSGNVTFIRTLTVNMAVVGTITQIPATPTISASRSTTLCVGDSVVLTSSSLGGNLWSTGATTQSITVTSAGSYSVSVINNGCSSSSSRLTNVLVNPLPSRPTITPDGPTTFCQGDDVLLSTGSILSRTASPLNYMWSSGENTPSITVTNPGTYTVVATDENGCKSMPSAGTTVTVNALANRPTIIANGPTTFCDGESVILTSTPSTSYLWSTGEITQSIEVTESGIYFVEVNNGTCDSMASVSRKITVNPIPETPKIIPSGPLGLCTGGRVTLTSSAISGNLWSNGATTQSITVSTAGTYSVSVSSLGCSSLLNDDEDDDDDDNDDDFITNSISIPTNEVIVTVNPIPTRPTITASGSTTFCAGGNVVLTSSAENNVWSNGEVTQSITVTNAGNYSVKSNNEGCLSSSSLSRSVTVNSVPRTPSITVVGSTTFNTGGKVILTSSSATVNRWSNGATTRSITVTRSGTYSVFVPGVCPSLPSEAVVVTVNDGQIIPARFAQSSGKESASSTNMVIYPNPTSGILNIDTDTSGDVSILNNLGQVVKETKVYSDLTNSVSLENLVDGIYFVKHSNKSETNKIILKK